MKYTKLHSRACPSRRGRAYRRHAFGLSKHDARNKLERSGHANPSCIAIGMLAVTPCRCSCHMCRNPRHSNYNSGKGKLTRQELRAGA